MVIIKMLRPRMRFYLCSHSEFLVLNTTQSIQKMLNNNLLYENLEFLKTFFMGLVENPKIMAVFCAFPETGTLESKSHEKLCQTWINSISFAKSFICMISQELSQSNSVTCSYIYLKYSSHLTHSAKKFMDA